MLFTKCHNLEPFGVEVGGDLDPKTLRKILIEHSLIVIRDFPHSSSQSLVEFASSLSEREGEIQNKLLHWDFGPIMTMQFDPEAQNYLFSDEDVPFHWDGAFHQEPLFLLFHCEDTGEEGGETLFCNTTSLFKTLDENHKRAAQDVSLNFETEKLAHYGGKISVPLLQTHPISGLPVLRYADEVTTALNPVTREIKNDSMNVTKLISDRVDRFTYVHRWERGDLVLADNFALIHGRKKLRNNLKRKFNRIQVL